MLIVGRFSVGVVWLVYRVSVLIVANLVLEMLQR